MGSPLSNLLESAHRDSGKKTSFPTSTFSSARLDLARERARLGERSKHQWQLIFSGSLGGIWNHHGNTPVGASRRAVLERFNWREKNHCECGQHDFLAWDLRLNKENVSGLSTGVHFLAARLQSSETTSLSFMHPWSLWDSGKHPQIMRKSKYLPRLFPPGSLSQQWRGKQSQIRVRFPSPTSTPTPQP